MGAFLETKKNSWLFFCWPQGPARGEKACSVSKGGPLAPVRLRPARLPRPATTRQPPPAPLTLVEAPLTELQREGCTVSD